MTQDSIQLVEPEVAARHAAVDQSAARHLAELKAMEAQAIAHINRRYGQYRRRLNERLPG